MAPANRQQIDLAGIKAHAQTLLKRAGVKDPYMVVKGKTFTGYRKDWIALYRGHSQFNSGPIFWINHELPAMMNEQGIPPQKLNKIVLDSIIHEYGHVIAEWGRYREPRIITLLYKNYPDEEIFAEKFITSVTSSKINPMLKKIIGLYNLGVTE